MAEQTTVGPNYSRSAFRSGLWRQSEQGDLDRFAKGFAVAACLGAMAWVVQIGVAYWLIRG